jgi:hypothetical protein
VAKQQSASKQVYRDYVTSSRIVLDHYAAQTVRTLEEGNALRQEAIIALEQERENQIGLILFSRTNNPDLWIDRINERIAYVADKLEEGYFEQIEKQQSPADDTLAKAAKAFGTDVETYTDFIFAGFTGIVSDKPVERERARVYTNLRDVINDWEKNVGFTKYVRFHAGFYWVAVQGSDNRRRKTKARRTRSARKKRVRS